MTNNWDVVVANIYIHKIFFMITLSLSLFLHTTDSKADISQFIEENYNSSYVEPSTPEINYNTFDPFEETNRKMFAFNQAVDKAILKPMAQAYRDIVPEGGRESIRNFLRNLESPTILFNDILQGEEERASNTVNRFVINSSVGFFGFGDPATDMGYPRHTEDFAQTLAVYGVESGPYIVSPLFGPSTPRHIAGRIVDFAVHPLTWYLQNQNDGYRYSYGISEAVVAREELLDVLDDIEASSTDYYVSIRNMYMQRRMDEISNGVPSDEPSEFSIDTARDLNLVF